MIVECLLVSFAILALLLAYFIFAGYSLQKNFVNEAKKAGLSVYEYPYYLLSPAIFKEYKIY